jgi:hypothetical protein
MQRDLAGKLAGPTARANRIAEGLIRTGRAFAETRAFGYICLRSTTGGFYWVAYDGGQLLSGATIKKAESLQDGFIAAMERAGTRARY